MELKGARTQRRKASMSFFGTYTFLSQRQTGRGIIPSHSHRQTGRGITPSHSHRQTGQGITPSPSGGGLGWGWSLLFLTLLALIAAAAAGPASANGSVRLVVIDEAAGPYLLRVGILPSDPTLGPLHVSTLIQDATGESAVDEAVVRVTADGAGTVSQSDAVNSPQSPQLYEANLWLDRLGEWTVTLDIEGDLGQASYAFSIRASEEGGFNLMFVIVAVAAALLAGSLVWSQLQRRRRLTRGR